MATEEQKKRILDGIRKQNERYMIPTKKKKSNENKKKKIS